MPFPLIPFAIKGALVLGKYIAAKGAAGKVVVGVAKTAKVIGTTNTIIGATAVVVTVGGVKWTVENYDRARKAHKAAKAGDFSKAARKLASLAASVHGTFTNNLAGDLIDWRNAGCPADGRVLRLAKDAYDTARQARPT